MICTDIQFDLNLKCPYTEELIMQFFEFVHL